MSQLSNRRTLALAIVIAAYVLSFFHRFAPAGIAGDLAATFQTSAASLGVLAATYFYVYTLMQVPTGVLVDTYGPRRILTAGSLIAGIGGLMFGLAPDLGLAMAGRTLIGLGVSVVFIAMLKLIALWFDERRFATLVGLSMLIGNAGSVLAGAPLAMAAEWMSWRSVFVGVAAVSFLLAIGSWFLLRDTQSGTSETGGKRFDRTAVLGALLGVLRNRATWPPVLVNFGLTGSFFTFGGLWLTPYLTRIHGFSSAAAAAHLSLYFGGFAVGCLIIGSLSDRLGRRKPVLFISGLTVCALWGLLLSGVSLTQPFSLAVFTAMGLTTAGFVLTWACAKEVNPPHLSGMSTSVTNMGGFLAAALLQPIVGMAVDRGWDGSMVDGVRQYSEAAFMNGMTLIAIFTLIGTLASLFVRETGCRNIWQKTEN